MEYKVKSTVDNNLTVKNNISDFEYNVHYNPKLGTSPVGYLVISLSSCMMMCIRGYYIKNKQSGVTIDMTNTYDGKRFDIEIKINKELDENEKKEILAYVDDKCNVKKALKSDLIFDIKFVK